MCTADWTLPAAAVGEGSNVDVKVTFIALSGPIAYVASSSGNDINHRQFNIEIETSQTYPGAFSILLFFPS